MTSETSTMKLDDLKRQASTLQRVLVRPSVDVKVSSQADRDKVVAVARRVIAEHRSVLIALKDR